MDEKAQVTARRKWFGSKENRTAIKLNENVQVGMEFANGLLGMSSFAAISQETPLKSSNPSNRRETRL